MGFRSLNLRKRWRRRAPFLQSRTLLSYANWAGLKGYLPGSRQAWLWYELNRVVVPRSQVFRSSLNFINLLLNLTVRERAYLVLKVYVNTLEHNQELEIFKHLAGITAEHSGRAHVRQLEDSFKLKSCNGERN